MKEAGPFEAILACETLSSPASSQRGRSTLLVSMRNFSEGLRPQTSPELSPKLSPELLPHYRALL